MLFYVLACWAGYIDLPLTIRTATAYYFCLKIKQPLPGSRFQTRWQRRDNHLCTFQMHAFQAKLLCQYSNYSASSS